MKESEEIIEALKKKLPVRLGTPYNGGYHDGISDAISEVRSVRIKRGLRKARKGKTKSQR